MRLLRSHVKRVIFYAERGRLAAAPRERTEARGRRGKVGVKKPFNCFKMDTQEGWKMEAYVFQTAQDYAEAVRELTRLEYLPDILTFGTEEELR